MGENTGTTSCTQELVLDRSQVTECFGFLTLLLSATADLRRANGCGWIDVEGGGVRNPYESWLQEVAQLLPGVIVVGDGDDNCDDIKTVRRLSTQAIMSGQ